ncbi:MAG: Dolichyl-phosphate beta-D-mannosyltransferase [uncultured bacterium]|nr:MAG: Dolichyl-phosphate beta-D-mannosyltransferase [uncultured bacterium]
MGREFEVLVVDDNSPDGTAQAVKRLAKKYPQVRVIVRTKDRGLGLSIGRGITESKGNIIIGMDADGNHDPNDLLKLIEGLKQETKLVVASRFVGAGGMRGWRVGPTFLFNGMFRLFGLPIWDNTSGYYAVRKGDLAQLGIDRIYYGYGEYHLRLVYFAHKAGWKIVEVPTQYQDRLGGQSKSKLIKMAFEYTLEAWKLRFGN